MINTDRTVARGPVTFGDVFAVREFRALFIAQSQSRVGDQLARVALSMLVYDATASATLTAVTYALTFLPPLISGPLLAGLADRCPRRTVMVTTEATSAVLVAAMAISGAPMAVTIVLLVVMVSIQPVFAAARSAIVPQLLGDNRYMLGLGVLNMTDQASCVLGFALGGALVDLFGPHAVLALDAVSFAVGAVLLRLGLRQRPAAQQVLRNQQRFPALSSMREGTRLILGDRRRRSLVLLAWLYGFYIVPEGVAAPFAHQIGRGEVAVGLLMAASPVGAAIGALVATRWLAPRMRPRLIVPFATLAGVPLALTIVAPSLPLALLLWSLSGLFTAYVVLGFGAFIALVPDAQRGQTVGLANSGLQAAQGLGIFLAGALADISTPAIAVTLCGVLGSIISVLAGIPWHRTTHPDRPDGAPRGPAVRRFG